MPAGPFALCASVHSEPVIARAGTQPPLPPCIQARMHPNATRAAMALPARHAGDPVAGDVVSVHRDLRRLRPAPSWLSQSAPPSP